MHSRHDPGSGSLASPSETGASGQGASDLVLPLGSDPLADVLNSIKLTGALFFLVDATSPWCVEVPEAEAFAEIILPRARHIISYHVVIEGRGFASVPGVAPVSFQAGDIIVFPHADPYLMLSAPGVPPELDSEETLQFFRAMKVMLSPARAAQTMPRLMVARPGMRVALGRGRRPCAISILR